MTKKISLQRKTEKETLELLDTYGKCAIVRPTGFGKTYILSHILRKFKNILYLYPSDIIRKTVIENCQNNKELDHIIFMTYQSLVRFSDCDFENLKHENIDLVIADECHKLGARKTQIAMTKLMKTLPKSVKLLGATATPERMDGVDEISMFFDNHITSKYTLHDAFQDGILQKPYYCFCSYSTADNDYIRNTVEAEIRKSDSTAEKIKLTNLLESRMIEIANLTNMPNVIKTTCDAYSKSNDYMKFIIFCSSFERLHKNKASITDWFRTAYPDHSINKLIVTSETPEYADNLNHINTTPTGGKHIDLIFTCNMLTLGYHVNNITGIFMYRSTESSIVYIQQLGRILNVGDNQSRIVFDVVDNIHRESIYQSSKQLEEDDNEEEYQTNLTETKSDENSDNINSKDKTALTANNCNSATWIHKANLLHPSDLIVTEHMATYNELIAKTVAEPIAIRCRLTWNRWLEKGGDPKNMTRSAILNQQAPDAVPLKPFCEIKHVSMKNVFDTMGVIDDISE